MSNEKGKGVSDGPCDAQDEPKEIMKESDIILLQRSVHPLHINNENSACRPLLGLPNTECHDVT